MNYSTKKILLNHQVFMEKLLANPDFFLELLKWRDKLGITDSNLGNFFDQKKSVYFEARKYGIELMEKIVKDENTEFINWLSGFIKKYELNRNWEQSIIDYIACGYYCPPVKSVYAHTDKNKNAIVLEIAPGTTKEDFERAWSEVKDKLNELPKKHARKFSHKSFKSLELVLKANKVKHEESLKGLELIAKLYEDDKDISEKTDRKRKEKLKITQQRLKRRGYAK